jgi:hypothetical protein
MKLFSNNKLAEVRSLIDAKRKDTNLKGFERWREIGDIVLADLKKRGDFFNTQQGLFFFDTEYRRPFPLSDDVGLAAIINERYGINSKEPCFPRILADLMCEAHMHGRKVETRRLAHYERAKNCLYVSRFDGEMYCLDGNSVQSVPNGTGEVFFFDDLALWEPFRYVPNTLRGEFDKQVIESVNFTDSALSVVEQQLFLKLWVLAVFFGNVQPTKIILLLLGDHGAGKTSALRRIQKLIFGRKVNLLSIEKEKQDGFIATITTDPIALFDNLDEHISWLPPALSRLATGVTFSRRQLYTTNEKVEFPGVSWLGITSRTVGFMNNQPDLPDRTLVLKLGRLVDRQPEEELLNAVAQRRNALWSELLDELNAVVRHLKENPEPVRVSFRMADFASFALKVATLWGCREEVELAFAKLERAQADLVIEKEPVHQVLEIWLGDQSNHGRSLDAGTLHREWSKLAEKHRIAWPFGSGKSLGQALSQLRFALQEHFEMEVNQNAHAKQNQYAFGPKRGDAEPAQKRPNKPVESEKLAEVLAGFAGFERGKL